MVKVKEEITFPRGIDNGATLRFRGKGHVQGDLIVKVGVKKHPLFRREGNDSLI
jgi:DnaJ-class molecular chaperone